MATQHGRKAYYQILLDPYRAELIDQLASKNDVRATAWIRDALYQLLERKLPASVYNEAKAKDEAAWRETVRRRVEGRTKVKETGKESEESAS